MRLLLAGLLPFIIIITPASALDVADSMQAWAGASPADKDNLLGKMVENKGATELRSSIRSCLDDTSKAEGHSNLQISEVFKVCYEQAKRDNI